MLNWQEALRKNFTDASAYSKKLEQWDDSVTDAVQLSRLAAVWDDCVQDVPYYEDLVRQGRAPAKIRTWADFHSIPYLTRAILQEQSARFLRKSGSPDGVGMTGGSTGTPVRFGVWHEEAAVLRMLKLVLWLRMGYQMGSRLFIIWGHSHLLGHGWRRGWNHLIRKIKDYFLGYHRVDAYSLWPEKCVQMAERLLKVRPCGLIGYASALDYFVRCCDRYHERFSELGLRFVMPAAEPPPRSDSFDLLRAVFRCPVVQEFGGVDFGQVGMKVDNAPFEVFPDYNVLETAAEGASSQGPQPAAVTTLYRRYTPLVRYKQGDLIDGVTRLEHGQVRSFQQLVGRSNDMVELSSGRQIHSVAFLHCVHQEPTVLNAQLVVTDAELTLRLVTLCGLSRPVEARIRHRLFQVAPELAAAKIEVVVDLETNLAGKRRWYVDKRTAPSR